LKVTYRITKPIFYKNKYVGNVELGISPTKFINELNSVFKIKMGISIDKSLVSVMLDKAVIPEGYKYILVDGDDNIKTHFYHKHEKNTETYKIDKSIPLENHLGKLLGYFVVGYDISDILKENKEFMYRIFMTTALMTLIIGYILHLSFNRVLGQFAKQAYTDQLTGLQNRQALNNLLRSKKSNLLILSNIKDFSLLNELYGIKTGNKILEEVAKAFKEFSQEYNFSAYRISSDEYVLVKLGDNFKEDEYSQTIEKLQEDINALVIKIDGDIIGVDIYSGVSIGLEHSLAEAQMALKKAREKSLPFLTYSKQVDTKVHSQSIIEVKKTVRYALNHKNIVPFFQPITDRNGKTVKYEALVRILEYSESGKTILTPDKFLDISMQSVLYIQIANKMLEQSLAFFANREEKISVNFLPNDFFDQSIMDTLMKGIENFDSPDRIVVEITEQEGVEDFSRLLSVVEKLRDIGVQIAIDDFGSGYANYAHILRIRPDYLKIDGSLIKNILTDTESKILVKSIIRFAKELNITTVAEYVENEEIFELLKEYGVDEYQGYYFGKPANLLNR
ncbi:MAG: EAL domain-containing protein, partial [Sulfurimonas sp.]|nr:EAL domain-containing protein [Sulfurimonas sp.]